MVERNQSLTTDWQTKCENLSQRAKQLLYSDTLADCAFIVGSDKNAMVIKSHKFFLAIASPIFEAMLYRSVPENDFPIPILDLKPKVFKILIEYIYTDSATINSCDEAWELYSAAKKYVLPHLITQCVIYLAANINPENVCKAYEFAKILEEPFLMEHCLDMFQQQTDQVLVGSSFKECTIETMIKIFEQNLLNVSEVQLFNAALRYSKSQTDKQESKVKHTIDLSAIFSTNACKNKEASEVSYTGLTIKDAIYNIRFLTFTLQEFANGPARSNLMTDAEALSIMVKLTSPNSAHPMPEGFTTSKNIVRITIDGRNLYSRS